MRDIQVFDQYQLRFVFLDAAVISIEVLPSILQHIPHPVTAILAIANMSNEEVYFQPIPIKSDKQFPLEFSFVPPDASLPPAEYIFQFHIYKVPRNAYDLPLWSADAIESINTEEKTNIIFYAHADRMNIIF